MYDFHVIIIIKCKVHIFLETCYSMHGWLADWFLVWHKRALWSNDWTGPIAIKFCRTTYPGNGRILLKLLPYCPKDCSTMPENVPQKVKIGVPNVL